MLHHSTRPGDRAPAPIAFEFSLPPYDSTSPLPPQGVPRLPRAAVVVLDLACCEIPPRLDEAVRQTRRRFPAAPVVLRVPRVTPATMRLAHRAAQLRARTVVGVEEPLRAALRSVLAHPDDLGDEVVEWMQFRGTHMSPVVATQLRQIVGGAACFPQLAELLEPLGEPGRTARQRFRAAGLPPPSAWHQMARALDHALQIQADPDARLAALALELGYSDRSGLTQQLIRTFDVTPVAVRGTLGWEWLVDRWLDRVRRDSSGRRLPLQ